MMTLLFWIAGIFLAGCLLAVIFIDHPVLFSKKKLTKADMLRGQAVIHFYGDKIKIDGETPAREDQVIGTHNEKLIQVYPGTHRIETIFAVSNTEKPKQLGQKREYLSFEVTLEQGQEYELKIDTNVQSGKSVLFLMPLVTRNTKRYVVCEKIMV